MDLAIILTYRCNSECSTCHVWRYPSDAREEVDVETLKKIPEGVCYLNLSGGEPTLRADLKEIVEALRPKAQTLEISSNGLLAKRLESIVSKHPDIKIRLSLDGVGATNDAIRGEVNGAAKKVEGMKRLKALGGRDLGFGVVIQERNASQLRDLLDLASECGVELATTTVHNGFQFYKSDNRIADAQALAKAIESLAGAMLATWSVKYWFRAYLSMGLAERALGHPRLLPCAAGTDFAFIDPWGDVFACNVRPDLKLGSLREREWNELFSGPHYRDTCDAVTHCTQNCWMVGSAKTAMRLRRFPSLPRWEPLYWVIRNKVRVTFGRGIRPSFGGAQPGAEPSHIIESAARTADGKVTRRIQVREQAHYVGFGEFMNR